MNANQFADEIKRLGNTFTDGTKDGALLCNELAARPDIADAALELARTLYMVAALGGLLNKINPS